MDLKEIAEWLHEMQGLTGDCVLEMRADGRGIAMRLSWRQDGQAMSYTHHMNGLELCLMQVAAQKQVMQQIRSRVEGSKGVPTTRKWRIGHGRT